MNSFSQGVSRSAGFAGIEANLNVSDKRHERLMLSCG